MSKWIIYTFAYSVVSLMFVCFAGLFSVGNDTAQAILKPLSGILLAIAFVSVLFAIPHIIEGRS